jgi:hypothetical protein
VDCVTLCNGLVTPSHTSVRDIQKCQKMWIAYFIKQKQRLATPFFGTSVHVNPETTGMTIHLPHSLAIPGSGAAISPYRCTI